MTLTHSAYVSRRIALVALFAVCCSIQFKASEKDGWKDVLSYPQTFVKSRVLDKGAPHSIVLIGENHASVKTQQQLADLLNELYKASGVDAILVEGSYGPIDASKLRNSVGSTGKTGDFWQGKLALGQLAGYEYVALTRDSVTIFGVEDMDAKREYTAGSARRSTLESLQWLSDMNNRALALAKQTSLTLDQTAAAQWRVQAELQVYEQKTASFAVLTKTDGSEYAEEQGNYTDRIERMTAIYNKIRPLLPEYDRVAKDADNYDRVVARAKKMESSGPPPSDADAEKLLSQLKVAKARLEKSSSDFDAVAQRSGYANANGVFDDLKQVDEMEKSLRATEPKLEASAKKFSQQEEDLQDQYYIVANAIRAAAGRPIPTLQSFLRDELDREQNDKRKNDIEVPFLADRDQHMVSNTMAYLAGHPNIRTVAMIIGYAHLDGLTQRFAKENVNVAAGKLSTCEDETEPWEERAWVERSHPADRLFAAARKRKELSRLLDQTYSDNMKELVAQLQSVNATGAKGLKVGNSRVFELHPGTTGGKAVVVTPDSAGLKANWGSYVVDSGVLPDGSGNHYQVVDRARAQAEAKGASTDKTLFATAYRTLTPQGAATKVAFGSQTETIERFKAVPPKSADKAPERVVIAAEGDTKPLNTALGSGGSGEPPWTNPLASFAEPPEGRPPFLFFTKNIERARRRINVLEKQDPFRIGDVASFEVGSDRAGANPSDALWFTPIRGDHARVLLISGENTEGFRKQLKDAAAAHLLENKQIALATCFDPKETDAIREALLDAGAVMVWTPENRISPEAARKLRTYMEKVDQTYKGPQASKALDEYMNRALELWHKDAPNDPDLQPLLSASRWVRMEMLVIGPVGGSIG
jgi:hypothetical protein